jgi:hemerythrin-like metal-binding protein
MFAVALERAAGSKPEEASCLIHFLRRPCAWFALTVQQHHPSSTSMKESSNMSTAAMQVAQQSPECLVHHVEMDRQHQILFDLDNRLQEAMLLGKGKEIVGVILARISSLGPEHNAYEERIMKDAHYPESREHIRQHEELAHTGRSLLERFESGETAMTIELAVFISSAIKRHIMTADRRLAEYLNSRRSAPLFRGFVARRATHRPGMSQGYSIMR